jgi:hypothetical protein
MYRVDLETSQLMHTLQSAVSNNGKLKTTKELNCSGFYEGELMSPGHLSQGSRVLIKGWKNMKHVYYLSAAKDLDEST